MKKIIGLTGPTGAGKSSLISVAENLGFKVIDCDKTARKATLPNSDGLKALTKVFGEEILENDGSLNRKLLAKKAFSSPEKTELLNKTIFPFITRLVLEECDKDFILLDAPTLIESGLNKKCDAVICVLALEEFRLERIIERDNLSLEDAKIRLNAGKPDEFYKENSHYVIFNNGDLTEFKRKFSDILNLIKER